MSSYYYDDQGRKHLANTATKKYRKERMKRAKAYDQDEWAPPRYGDEKSVVKQVLIRNRMKHFVPDGMEGH